MKQCFLANNMIACARVEFEIIRLNHVIIVREPTSHARRMNIPTQTASTNYTKRDQFVRQTSKAQTGSHREIHTVYLDDLPASHWRSHTKVSRHQYHRRLSKSKLGNISHGEQKLQVRAISEAASLGYQLWMPHCRLLAC
jgi:arylamine N-acetyltransferase